MLPDRLNNIHTTSCMLIGTKEHISSLAYNYGKLNKYSPFVDATEFVLAVSFDDIFNNRKLFDDIFDKISKYAPRVKMHKFCYMMTYFIRFARKTQTEASLIKSNMYVLLQVCIKNISVIFSVSCNGKLDDDLSALSALCRECSEELSMELDTRYLFKEYQTNMRKRYNLTVGYYDTYKNTRHVRNPKDAILYLIVIEPLDYFIPPYKAEIGQLLDGDGEEKGNYCLSMRSTYKGTYRSEKKIKKEKI
jgi:hypothetical protein